MGTDSFSFSFEFFLSSDFFLIFFLSGDFLLGGEVYVLLYD